jgi:hypothetical protein
VCETWEAVAMEIAVFWDMTPHSLVDIYQHLEETICFHLQGRWDHEDIKAASFESLENIHQESFYIHTCFPSSFHLLI